LLDAGVVLAATDECNDVMVSSLELVQNGVHPCGLSPRHGNVVPLDSSPSLLLLGKLVVVKLLKYPTVSFHGQTTNGHMVSRTVVVSSGN
jgi:hypothetical protein